MQIVDFLQSSLFTKIGGLLCAVYSEDQMLYLMIRLITTYK